MRIVVAIILPLPTLVPATRIRQQNANSCIGDQSSLQGRNKEYLAQTRALIENGLIAVLSTADRFLAVS